MAEGLYEGRRKTCDEVAPPIKIFLLRNYFIFVDIGEVHNEVER